MSEHATMLAGTLHVDNNAYEFRLRARVARELARIGTKISGNGPGDGQVR